jgi:hypothetical protein
MESSDTAISSGAPVQTRSLAMAMLLELVPLFSLISAYVMALLLIESGASVLALIAALGFSVSGLGWFYVGKTVWGWKVLGGRLIVVVAAAAMGFWVLASSLSALGCESSRCVDDGPQVANAFVWATAVVWMVALLSPIASALTLAMWVRRHPIET